MSFKNELQICFPAIYVATLTAVDLILKIYSSKHFHFRSSANTTVTSKKLLSSLLGF